MKEDVRDPARALPPLRRRVAPRRWVVSGGGRTSPATRPCCPASACPSHVAELRIVVSRAHRRQGIGRTLPHARCSGLPCLDGISKVVVEVPAELGGARREGLPAPRLRRRGAAAGARARPERRGPATCSCWRTSRTRYSVRSWLSSAWTSRTSRRSPARAERAGSGPGAGEVRAALGEEGPDPLASVRPGGAGTDGQRLAAQRTLLPRHSDLAQQPLGGDLGGA